LSQQHQQHQERLIAVTKCDSESDEFEEFCEFSPSTPIRKVQKIQLAHSTQHWYKLWHHTAAAAATSITQLSLDSHLEVVIIPLWGFIHLDGGFILRQ